MLMLAGYYVTFADPSQNLKKASDWIVKEMVYRLTY